MPHLVKSWKGSTLFVLLMASAGCSALRPAGSLCSLTSPPAPLLSAAASAQAHLEEADALREAGNDGCVDYYFVACSWAWQWLGEADGESPAADAIDCYNAALEKLIASAQRFQRLDPAEGLRVRLPGRSLLLPVVHHGAPWRAADYQRLLPPPKVNHRSLLTRRYGSRGIGVPLVAERARDACDPTEVRFYPERFYFGSTAVLRFHPAMASDAALSAVLEFHSPLEGDTLCLGECEWPLARDLTAPLAQTLAEAPRTYLAGFIEPGGGATTAKLALLEPYQAGKIPVVLIHGLFSDPQSWADLINDLRATPGFTQRHQLWVFRYPTGQGFLQSAAMLRRELRDAIATFDGGRCDPALRQIVLAGHSMGGLIAKLQVAHSEELVWSELANRPLEEIVTTPEARIFLAEACYFEPVEEVGRVIFIASPHRGALCSSSTLGRYAALLVEPSAAQAELHEQLMRDNPDTFNPLFERRFPTSIDMLVPSSPLLQAMHQMKLHPRVKLHNIIGVSCPLSLDGPSDGVVSVHSATHAGCSSVLAINAPHGSVHRNVATSREVLRILDCR